MKTEPQKEHAWLLKLCGDWTSKGEMTMQPGQPGETWETTEHVRPIGDLWVQCEGKGQMKDGSVTTTIMTTRLRSRRRRNSSAISWRR